MPNSLTPTYSTVVDLLSSKLDNMAFLPHPDTIFPTTAKLRTETRTNLVEYEDDNTSSSRNSPECSKGADIPKSLFVIPPPVCIYESLSLSNNKLCFIQYMPEGTMIRRWYLVQVDLEALMSLDAHFQTSGSYCFNFLAKHPSDAGKSDDSR